MLALFPYLSVCVCLLCVWLCGEQRHLESGVSQCDVRLWCFPSQRSGTVGDGGVMSSSSVLLRCSHTSAATFFFSPLCSSPAPWCLAYFYCVSVCIFPSILISFVARRWSRRSLAVVRLSFFPFFFMNEMCCLLPVLFLYRALMMNTKCDHTTSSSVISLPLIGWGSPLSGKLFASSRWMLVCLVGGLAEDTQSLCVSAYACGFDWSGPFLRKLIKHPATLWGREKCSFSFLKDCHRAASAGSNCCLWIWRSAASVSFQPPPVFGTSGIIWNRSTKENQLFFCPTQSNRLKHIRTFEVCLIVLKTFCETLMAVCSRTWKMRIILLRNVLWVVCFVKVQ